MNPGVLWLAAGPVLAIPAAARLWVNGAQDHGAWAVLTISFAFVFIGALVRWSDGADVVWSGEPE